MSKAPAAAMRLLLQGLSEPDTARVTRFLSLGGERLSQRWEIVPDGDVQVLIVEGIEPDTIFGMVEPPLVTLHVVEADDHRLMGDGAVLAPEQCLMRPLQYEALLDALCEAERIWQAVHQPTAVHRPLASEGRNPAARMPLPMRPMPPIPGPPNASTLATPQDTATRPRAFTLDPRSTFRLRRWPPTELLLGDRHKFRLATFLSSRGVDLDQLERLSNVPRDQCLDFLVRMAAADLLTIKPVMAGASTVAVAIDAPRAATTPVAAPPPKVDAGLLSRLRRRLGIAWGRGNS